MRKLFVYFLMLMAINFIVTAGSGISSAEELVVKNCEELLRMAQNLQEDLKTVDTMLGSAIEAGNMDRINNYKMRKAGVQKQLQSVLQAVDLKSCVKGK